MLLNSLFWHSEFPIRNSMGAQFWLGPLWLIGMRVSSPPWHFPIPKWCQGRGFTDKILESQSIPYHLVWPFVSLGCIVYHLVFCLWKHNFALHLSNLERLHLTALGVIQVQIHILTAGRACYSVFIAHPLPQVFLICTFKKKNSHSYAFARK